MAGTTGMERPPYRRRPQSEWAVIRVMFAEGSTAKALAARFGGSERTIYAHMAKHGLRRRDQPTEACTLDAETVRDEVRAARGCAADAAVRALPEGASLGEAARAAATTAIAMLRDTNPARSYTYARLAGTLERLARGAVGDGERGGDGTLRGAAAALDFLRREAVGG